MKRIEKSIKDITLNYKKAFENAMGGMNRTIELSLNLSPDNIISEVNARFSIYQFKRKFKKDTALFWSIITNLIATISILVTVVLDFV